MTKIIEGRAAHNAEVQHRAEADMAAIGVDAAFIDRLVETFYARIRDDDVLGPVFNDHLVGRWPEHMVRMKAFWSALTFKTGAYGGKPVQAHMDVGGLSADLFPRWLALFSKTLDDIAPGKEAHDWFMATAERIAKSLTLSLFYNPAQDDPAAGNASKSAAQSNRPGLNEISPRLS